MAGALGIGGRGGGRNLGAAQGSITIDTSGVKNAAIEIKRVGNDMTVALKSAGAEATKTGKKIAKDLTIGGANLTKFSRQINQLRGELLAVGVAGAALSAIGIRTAAGIQEARIQLKGMVGSEQAAVRLMDELRKQASAAGVPFSDILGASRLLLPTLQGNTEELEKWLPLIRRVAVLNQREGLTGAGFAVNEALSSGGTDLVSLTERFNISRTQLREALTQTGGDFAAALDIVLTKMGITLETADEMGTTFNASLRAARDAAAQLLAAGFQPLLETLTPIIRATADWLNELRQSNPEIAKVGAGIAAIAAVGAPTLLFLGQMVESITRIKRAIDAMNAAKLATLGGIAKGALAGVLAVGAGVGVGIGATRAIGRATGREDLANADLSQLWQQIRQILFVVVAGLSEVVVQIGNLIITAAQKFNQGIAGMLQGMAGFVQFLGSVLPENLGGSQLQQASKALEGFAENLRKSSDAGADAARDKLESGQDALLKGALDFLGLAQTSGGAGGPGSGADIDAGAAADAERLQRLEDFNKQIQKIEENRHKQSIEAEKQYSTQRNETIKQYNKQAEREEADFQRGRRRQEKQFQDDVDQINKARLEQEIEWRQKLDEQIAEWRSQSQEQEQEIQEEGNKRIADIEEDYREDRERREREHRNNLLTAASRLDATAIAEEQRRFKEQNKTAEETFQDRIKSEEEALQKRLDNERQNLEERIQQEERAHQKRIDEARKADDKRIDDMRIALDKQQRLEDEDRAIRLQRAKQDHQEQLAAQAEAHRLRLQQIREQAEEERKLLLEQFEDIMDLITERGLGGSTTADTQQSQSLDPYRAGRDTSEFEEWWQQFIARQSSYASGGAVTNTGLAMVHGSRSRPEYMLDSGTTAALRSMLGGGFNQAGLLNAVAGGNRSMTLNLSNGAIQVNAAPGQSTGDIGAAVRMELENLFESMAN